MTETFATIANSTEQIQNGANAPSGQTVQNDCVQQAANGNGIHLVSDSMHQNDENSCYLFDGDEIIPETQYDPCDSDDSGESVNIPLYSNKKETDSHTTCTNDTEDESEFVNVRPDSNCPETMELQSQLIMDHSVVRDLETSYSKLPNKNIEASSHQSNSRNTKQSEDAPDSTNSNQKATPSKHCVDRSQSTTPDLDFLQNANSADKEALNEPAHDNGNSNGNVEQQQNSVDDDETQMFSENIFDASTQRVFKPSDLEKSTDDDIFGEATQKVPEHSNNLQPSTDDIFGAATQNAPIFLHPAAISTPHVRTKPRTVVPADDIFDAATQMEDDIFEAGTQMLPSDKHSTAKKTVTWRQQNSARSIEPDTTNENLSGNFGRNFKHFSKNHGRT